MGTAADKTASVGGVALLAGFLPLYKQLKGRESLSSRLVRSFRDSKTFGSSGRRGGGVSDVFQVGSEHNLCVYTNA